MRADPATTEELGTVPELGLEDTKHAIDAASKAFKTWSKTTAKVRLSYLFIVVALTVMSVVQQRHDILMKWYALMREHSDDLSRLIVSRSVSP